MIYVFSKCTDLFIYTTIFKVALNKENRSVCVYSYTIYVSNTLSIEILRFER